MNNSDSVDANDLVELIDLINNAVKKHGITRIKSIIKQSYYPHKDMKLMRFIQSAVLDEYRITYSNLIDKDLRGVVTDARKTYIYLLRKHTRLSSEEIRKLLKRTPPVIYSAIKEFENMDNKIHARILKSYNDIDQKIIQYKKING